MELCRYLLHLFLSLSFIISSYHLVTGQCEDDIFVKTIRKIIADIKTRVDKKTTMNMAMLKKAAETADGRTPEQLKEAESKAKSDALLRFTEQKRKELMTIKLEYMMLKDKIRSSYKNYQCYKIINELVAKTDTLECPPNYDKVSGGSVKYGEVELKKFLCVLDSKDTLGFGDKSERFNWELQNGLLLLSPYDNKTVMVSSTGTISFNHISGIKYDPTFREIKCPSTVITVYQPPAQLSAYDIVNKAAWTEDGPCYLLDDMVYYQLYTESVSGSLAQIVTANGGGTFNKAIIFTFVNIETGGGKKNIVVILMDNNKALILHHAKTAGIVGTYTLTTMTEKALNADEVTYELVDWS
ncbi:hypothetical protein SNEBB_008321 [Seison nebaliae]|nr:hypothetical protein SNEBB_008321 [Seison nebaliae]